MAVQELVVPFADVSGDSLRWAIGLPPREPLATRTVTVPGWPELELRILGASHQVLLHDAGRLVFSETVACDLDQGAALPDRADRAGYRFTAGVEVLDPGAFAGRVAELTHRLAGVETAIVAGFPGHPFAVTALAMRSGPGHLAWDSWHAYPQTGELVTTTTQITTEVTRHG